MSAEDSQALLPLWPQEQTSNLILTVSDLGNWETDYYGSKLDVLGSDLYLIKPAIIGNFHIWS